jgi:mono/diheme cytochrome c family protein/disulfide bond formation protein DsbB
MVSSKTMLLKLIIAGVLIPLVWYLTGIMGFPPVFQRMFVIYVLLGLVVFLLLDAPAAPRLAAWKAILLLVVFYVAISAVYVGGAWMLPQYNPAVEKEKIDKIVKPKLETPEQRHAKLEALLKKTEELKTKTDNLMAELNKFAPAPQALVGTAEAPSIIKTVDIVARGKEVYDLHECYNCHKIGGKGSVKKRGPVLDNIGNYLTPDDVKKKIFDPGYLYAEGFEKEHKKGVMPDKYKELMSDEEVDALAAYLATLKDGSVETPKPVFVKSNVTHGFIVYGYVRDSTGKPVPDVKVEAKPLKAGRESHDVRTNKEGYYEIFLHIHNEDVGTKIEVTAKNAKKEIVANYNPEDKVAKRQTAVDLVI